MLRRTGFALLFAIVAFVVAATAGYFLIEGVSSNTHDRPVEAGMTGVFVFGPAGALLGAIAGFVFGGRRRATLPMES